MYSGNQVKPDFIRRMNARSQKEITIFLPDPRKLGDDFPKIGS